MFYRTRFLIAWGALFVGWVLLVWLTSSDLRYHRLSPLAWVEASTTRGQAVEIGGMDDMNATVQSEAKGGTGQTFATLLALAGLGGVVTRTPTLAFFGIGGGLGVAFVPRIISTAFTSAPAASGFLLSAQPLVAWWTPATMLLYPPLLLLRMAQEPMFWVGLVLFLWASRLRQKRYA